MGISLPGRVPVPPCSAYCEIRISKKIIVYVGPNTHFFRFVSEPAGIISSTGLSHIELKRTFMSAAEGRKGACNMKRTTVLRSGCFAVFILLYLAAFCLAGGFDFNLEGKQEAVLAFVLEPGGAGSTSGSGFLMDDSGHLLTSSQVFKGDSTNVSVRAYGGGKYPIKRVVARDESLDLVKVLLDIPRERPPRLDISEALPTLGERLLVLGSRNGEDRIVGEGLVSAIHVMPDGKKLIEMTSPVQQGCCGGPVINMRGQVIGVSSPKTIAGKTRHLAIPIRYAKELGTRNNFPWYWANLRASGMKSLSNVIPVESPEINR